jgi:hypothetical protein
MGGLGLRPRDDILVDWVGVDALPQAGSSPLVACGRVQQSK